MNEFPATKTVHWPTGPVFVSTGPVFVCDCHYSGLPDNVKCINCQSLRFLQSLAVMQLHSDWQDS